MKNCTKSISYLQWIIKNKWHEIYVSKIVSKNKILYNIILIVKIEIFFYFKDLLPTPSSIHLMIWPYHLNITMLMPSNWNWMWNLLLPKALALTGSSPPLTKPQAPQSHMNTYVSKVLKYPSVVFDTFDGGSKINILSWNFYDRCRNTICTCGKKIIFFEIYVPFQK
jgi:hypothetical protein